MTLEKRSCDTCAWFESKISKLVHTQSGSSKGVSQMTVYGVCRRSGPIILNDARIVKTNFAVVIGDDWCSSYKPVLSVESGVSE